MVALRRKARTYTLYEYGHPVLTGSLADVARLACVSEKTIQNYAAPNNRHPYRRVVRNDAPVLPKRRADGPFVHGAYTLYEYDAPVLTGSLETLARLLCVRKKTILNYSAGSNQHPYRDVIRQASLKTLDRMYGIYHVYQGDRLIQTGTRADIMRRLGIKRATFDYYLTPTYAARADARERDRTYMRDGVLRIIAPDGRLLKDA